MTMASREVPEERKGHRSETMALLSAEGLVRAVKGSKDGKYQPVLTKSWEHLLASGASRESLLNTFVTQERCSAAFAKQLLDDPAFRARVERVSLQFAESGERFVRLEEAEIFLSLYGKQEVPLASLKKSMDLERKFPHLHQLTPQELMYQRVEDMLKTFEYVRNSGQEKKMILELVNKTLLRALPSEKRTELEKNDPKDFAWEKTVLKEIFANTESLRSFFEDKTIRSVYEQATKGQQIDATHRQIQLFWKKMPNGERVPCMDIMSRAINPKTEHLSVLSAQVEGTVAQGQEGTQERVLKDLLIVVDKQSRGSGEGMKFLVDQLPLAQKLQVDRAQFNANIKIGSYTWRKISDIDEREMGKKYLNEKDWERIGDWDKGGKERARDILYKEHIWPTVGKKMRALLDEAAREKLVDEAGLADLEAQYHALEKKLEQGTLTMEDLGDMGAGKEFISFDGFGTRVPNGDKNAKLRGHIGKAALMEYSWIASVGVKKADMFRLVDKLMAGKPLKKLLAKAGIALYV